MNIEAGKLINKETEKKKLSDKEKTFELKKNIDFNLKKEKLSKSEQTEKQLDNLKDLLNDGKLDSATSQLINEVTQSGKISQEQIQEIFDKIDEIENNEAANKYLPEEARITKEEYKKALTDDIYRVQVLTKIGAALTILAQHVNPNSGLGLNLFTGFMAVLDKNLILIQENHIDIKNSLEEVDKKKMDKKASQSFWEKIKEFLQELFN